MAARAGHDINYIALSGALHAIGRKGGPPMPPLNLVGDFGGGGMFLAFGIVCGLLEAQRSGKGQVVDSSMVDGSATLMAGIYGMYAQGTWKEERGVNILDTGAPFYNTYETKDGKWVSIGSIEQRFYADLLQRLGLAGEKLPAQHDRERWPEMRERFAAVFRTKTRAEWEQVFMGSDACFAPVLSFSELKGYSHNAARKTFVEPDGVLQPAPAPRFSRTVPEIGRAPREVGADTAEVLASCGFTSNEIADLTARGIAGPAA
jgi:alpha-methylacyl-CoA racemase